MRLMAGLDVPTERRAVWFDGKDVTGVAGAASARSRWSTSSSSTIPNLTVCENIASPLARRQLRRRREIDRRVRRNAALPKLTPHAATDAARALWRPAAAHGAGARAIVKDAGARAARRAARQSRLQAARGAARGAAAHLLRHRRDLRLRNDPEPVEAASCSAARPRRWRRAGATRPGPTVAVYRRAEQPRDGARIFSDPPINTLPV